MTHQVAQRDRLARLSAAGVSIWLDDLGRQRLRDGSRCLGLFPLHGSTLLTCANAAVLLAATTY